MKKTKESTKSSEKLKQGTIKKGALSKSNAAAGAVESQADNKRGDAELSERMTGILTLIGEPESEEHMSLLKRRVKYENFDEAVSGIESRHFMTLQGPGLTLAGFLNNSDIFTSFEYPVLTPEPNSMGDAAIRSLLCQRSAVLLFDKTAENELIVRDIRRIVRSTNFIFGDVLEISFKDDGHGKSQYHSKLLDDMYDLLPDKPRFSPYLKVLGRSKDVDSQKHYLWVVYADVEDMPGLYDALMSYEAVLPVVIWCKPNVPDTLRHISDRNYSAIPEYGPIINLSGWLTK
jgi:hypothetical protein